MVLPSTSGVGGKYLAKRRKVQGLLPRDSEPSALDPPEVNPLDTMCYGSEAIASKLPCVSHCTSLLCKALLAGELPATENVTV